MMCKCVSATALLLILILTCVEAEAFDGRRKGFILGAGGGIAPLMQSHPDADNYPDDDGAGIAYHFLLGYAWDEHNMIIADRQSGVGQLEQRGYDLTTTQTFFVIAWYHYFGPAGRSFFTTAGLGTSAWCYEDRDSDFDACTDVGGGMLLGCGYEFAPHWQFDARVAAGHTKNDSVDYTLTQFSIQISGHAF